MPPTLDGLGEFDLPSRKIVHTVWSGDNARGLVAVHVGRLITETEDTVVWGEVSRIDHDGVFVAPMPGSGRSGPFAYSDQPEPQLGLQMRERDESGEGGPGVGDAGLGDGRRAAGTPGNEN